LFDGSSAEADATLRAMKEVATARGAHPLSDPDWVALSAAHTVVFRGVGLLDTEALPDITSAALADALAPDHREHAAAFLAVMATVDGAVDAARIETADAFVDALGLHESYLRDLGALAQRKFAEVRADVARHNVRSFTGVETNADFDGESLDEWLNVYREHPDPELHARFDALRAAPVGTFGRTFADFYADNGFVFPGVPESANQQFVVPHDSAHVLSGYDTSVQGEILVSAFTAGMHPDDAVSAHVLPVIMVFHLGIPMNDFAGSSTGALDPRKFWVAWSRGDQITGDTLSHDWDFWAHVDQPLDAVRAVMGVAPLDPADAADGEYPDWYHANA
jgi:hypothetical protein